MLYIRLFHGRVDPEQDMDDWGSDGPIFGPYHFVHTTYTSFVRLGRQDGMCDELNTIQDMLYSTVISSRRPIQRYGQAFSFSSAMLIVVISSTMSSSFL